MFEVRVPMTSANVACGFDTLGIAFQEYSIFNFELSDRLEFVNFEEEFCNEDNLVYIAFKKALNKSELSSLSSFSLIIFVKAPWVLFF